MVVVVLTDCPAKLRGDLSKWLFEINTGVYVGNISARVRKLLWERICENLRHGQATMVYSAQGEQKMEFCVHNTSWEIVDFDGIKLMRRPAPKHDSDKMPQEYSGYSQHSQSTMSASPHAHESMLQSSVGSNCEEGFSKAYQFERNRRIQISKQKPEQNQRDYVVVDIETTGLSHLSDKIIEIGALRVSDGKPAKEFHSLIKCEAKIPESVKKLTGITDEMLLKEGQELHLVLKDFLPFLSDSLLIFHNAAFDLNFLQAACRIENFPIPRNKYKDTAILARKQLKALHDYKLQTIANALSIDTTGMHRALRDCYITYGIYTKLNEKQAKKIL